MTSSFSIGFFMSLTRFYFGKVVKKMSDFN